MTRGVRLYVVGSFVLVSLAGCGRGFFQSAEREPWRAEAEIACLKSGAVKENAELVRISPISGPGVCGAEYPLKVAALGEGSSTFGFADDSLRPPGSTARSSGFWNPHTGRAGPRGSQSRTGSRCVQPAAAATARRSAPRHRRGIGACVRRERGCRQRQSQLTRRARRGHGAAVG